MRFEITYKDSQIEELKEIILNASTFTNKDEDVELRKPILLGDLTQQSSIIPKSVLKFDMEELKNLRLQVKEQNR